MGVFAFVLLILVVTIALPLFILMYFITRWREQHILSREDESEIGQLWEMSERLESRLHNIERLLGQSEDASKNHNTSPQKSDS